MRWPGVGIVRRLVHGGGRRAGPGRLAVGLLLAVTLALVVGAVVLLRWATRSDPPALALARAASALRDPPALDSALDVTWTWSVGGTGRLEDRWLTLVAPTLPPGLCAPARPERRDDVSSLGELDAALRQLDGAVVRGAEPAELERRLLALREAGGAAPGSRADFVVRYNLARGYGAAGDWAAAAEMLEPVLGGWISSDRVPEVTRSRAEDVVRRGRVDRTLALDAVHGRYLAGTVAYRRGEAQRAVGYFRRAINAFHYLLALDGGDELGPEGHHQRVVADPGVFRCPGTRVDDALTSLDAYAGLVAAYMADEGFRDPAGLPAEVARSRLEIDPGDPFGPVLEHARLTGGDPGRTPVPENLLWAASNLQRVYHHNRLRPEPRLEVTRAVLLLHLTGDETWTDALRERGGADVCAMLGGIGDDLRGDAAIPGLGRSDPTAVDSARAAVAVQAFARLERDCSGASPAAVEPAVRSAWIRLGGSYLTRGVGAAYEEMRTTIVAELGGSTAPVPVVEERLEPVLARIEEHRRDLSRGRVPAELPADLPVDPVRRFVEEWWEALWVDVARSLAARVREPTGDGTVRAGEVPRLLTALESATRHAGLRPQDVYRPGETAELAATGGAVAEASWRLRTWIRNRPGPALAATFGALLVLGAAAVLVHVSAWRYRLLVGRRFYREEAADVARRVGRAA